MRRITALGLVLVMVVAVFALSGCQQMAQKATEAAVEKATGVKVDTNAGTISTTDEDGNTTELSAAEGTYPDGFPSDFPQYANGKVDSGLKGSTNGEESFTVIIMTADAAADVFKWYTDELKSAGWKIDQSMDGTNSEAAFASIVAIKDGQKAGITISRAQDDPETSIMVGLGPDKK
ncbi:MAG: hypothetical protein HGB10_02375 [Coriobacteriia bacterium]|nr:hypothetical protein [Coriobacteriia bacterium]